MNCPRCQSPNMTGNAFCGKCGAPLPQEGAQVPTPAPVAAAAPTFAKPSNKPYYYAAGAAVVLAIILLFLSKLNLSKGQTVPGAPVQIASKVAGSNLEKPEDIPAGMPQDVTDWLKHLQKIEERKQALTLRQIADMKVFEEMIGALGPHIGETDPFDQTGEQGKAPADVTKGKFGDLRPDWKQLLEDYRSYPPPAECKSLADTYDSGLNEIPGMIGDLVDVLNETNSDPSKALTKLSEMKNKSYGNIDRSFQESDLKLADICRKYKVQKWFNIKADALGGDFLSKSGF